MRVALLAAFPLHVIPGLEEENRGGHYATWLPQLSAAWAKEPGLEIHWLVVSRRICRDAPVRWNNQTFHLLHVPEKLRTLRFYHRDCRLIREKLDEIRPHLVHAWGTEDCYGLAAVRSRREFLLSVQGILSEYVRRTPQHPLVHLQAVIERYVFRRARQIVCESSWACDIMRRLAPRATVRRIEYGVPDIFLQIPWTPDPAKPVAIFVGTPDRRKGIQDAIAAFASPRLAMAELWIVGDGGSGFARELERRSTPNVRWLGRKSVAETATLMAQAWCLVIPTRADTGPMVMKEARAIGLPIVSTRHGGQTDYIEEGKNGFFVECGEIALLAERLARILGDFAFAQQLGAWRHDEQRQVVSAANTAAGCLEVYRALAPADLCGADTLPLS